MKKDGIWNVQRRNNVEERRGRKYVVNLHILQPWVGQQWWPYSEILILDPPTTDPLLKHQTELILTENRKGNSTLEPQSSRKTCNGAVGTNLWIIPGAWECQNVSPSPAAWARQSTSAVTWDKGSSWSLCEICHPWHNFGSANLQNNSPGITLGHLRTAQISTYRIEISQACFSGKGSFKCPRGEVLSFKTDEKPRHGWNSVIFRDHSNPNSS